MGGDTYVITIVMMIMVVSTTTSVPSRATKVVTIMVESRNEIPTGSAGNCTTTRFGGAP
jgi:hypothetical protein